MKVAQIYNLVNTMYGEIVGGDTIVAEDLSNVVDIGRQIFDATSVDKFVNKLVDHIGRLVIVERPYQGTAPSLLMDSWEYGSVKEKITMHRLPVAESNESWNLVDGQVYEQDTFNQPDVMVTFFDKYITFEVTLSIADKQVKSAFDNATQLNSFISMIYEAMSTALTVRLDALIERTINNFMGATIHAEYPDPSGTTPYAGSSKLKAVNLLKLYNDTFGLSGQAALTVDRAIYTPEFIRFAIFQLKLYTVRLKKMSTLFNVKELERFTPEDRMKIVLLNDFAAAADVYLRSDTYHNDLVKLPQADIVPYWQGTGADYAFNNISSINVEVDDGNGGKFTVAIGGILGCVFDIEAAGVSCLSKNMTMHRNDRAEFQNVWDKTKVGYFNDLSENGVVFFIA